jgi:hypothetical protein
MGWETVLLVVDGIVFLPLSILALALYLFRKKK